MDKLFISPSIIRIGVSTLKFSFLEISEYNWLKYWRILCSLIFFSTGVTFLIVDSNKVCLN